MDAKKLYTQQEILSMFNINKRRFQHCLYTTRDISEVSKDLYKVNNSKICIGCISKLPILSFKTRTTPVCKSCYKKLGLKDLCKGKRQKIYQNLKAILILKYKESNGCIDCGETNPLILDFDHIECLGNKSFDVSCSYRYNIDRIFEELDKCVVRCVYCHRLKTLIDRDFYSYIDPDTLNDYIKDLKRKAFERKLFNSS